MSQIQLPSHSAWLEYKGVITLALPALVGVVMRVIAALLVALLFQSGSSAAELTVIGAWTLNRELTTMPDRGERQPPDGRGGGQGRGGRVGGRGGGVGGR